MISLSYESKVAMMMGWLAVAVPQSVVAQITSFMTQIRSSDNFHLAGLTQYQELNEVRARHPRSYFFTNNLTFDILISEFDICVFQIQST